MQIRFGAILISVLAMPLAAQAQTFPGADWQRKTPAEAGINPQLLKDAIDFSVASEIKNPRDLKLNHYRTFGREPFGDAIGPIKDRGDLTGVIIHKGVLVAEWGEPQRVDMTHSVTKSFLSSVVGLAYDGGMIRNVDDLARDYMAPIQLYNPLPAGNRAERMGAPDLLDLFVTPHNAPSPGIICCGRPATGRARFGASPIGRTARPTSPTNGSRGRATRRERSTNTTIRA